ncbi:MAG TPA: hypothetical protein DIU37_00410 [Opitutae bacterium]|nr:hypothetical protein [Opitutae bacterium]
MKQTLIPLSVLCLMLVHAVLAQDPKTFTNKDDIANDGYDIVAYFKYGDPRKGSQAYSVQLPNNTIYLFSSKETRDLFQANPDKYFPQYGGFCAYAMAKTGEKVKVDPTVWAIVKGKLYLNYSKSIGKRWQKKRSQYIKEANENWEKISESFDK